MLWWLGGQPAPGNGLSFRESATETVKKECEPRPPLSFESDGKEVKWELGADRVRQPGAPDWPLRPTPRCSVLRRG